jgi:magnesium transporter
MINSLHPAEVADMLEALKPLYRELVWELIESESRGEVLVELNDEVRTSLIETTGTEDLIHAANTLETDDLADILQDLPNVVIQEVLLSLSNQDRNRLETVLAYDEDCAGGLMNTDTVTVRPDVTLDVVLRYLRKRGEIPEQTDNLIVVDRTDYYIGLLPLSTLLTNEESLTVAELMQTDEPAILVTMDEKDVALLFEQRDLISAPVVNEENSLLGRITIDDVVDVIREEADHSIMSMAGLDEEQDMFAPATRSARRRTVWLGINLCTALLASWVIGFYEETLEKVIALAILMPVVASMGGIAGSQTLTLVIRGIALRQIGRTNASLLLGKELTIGVLNGLLWAVVVAVIAGTWFHSTEIGLLIGSAMIINMVCAALAGVTIPLTLERLGIDPALAGGVLLTTITDVVGFVAFLGLATLYLT